MQQIQRVGKAQGLGLLRKFPVKLKAIFGPKGTNLTNSAPVSALSSGIFDCNQNISLVMASTFLVAEAKYCLLQVEI